MTRDQKLSEIGIKVGRLEIMHESSTKAISDLANNVNRLVEKLEQSDDAAKEALERAKSAHYRLNKIDKIIYWIATTIIGAVVIALVSLLWTSGNH